MNQLRCSVAPLFILLSGMFCIVANSVATADQPANKTHVQQLIEDLGHDQYHRRQTAKTELTQLAIDGKAASLPNGLRHPSLEVRASVSDILLMIRQQEFVRDLDRLSNPNYPINQLSSLGWKQFSEVAGTNKEARLAFAAICRQHPSALASMRSLKSKQAEFTNPFQLSVDDHVGWMILLLPAMPQSEDSDKIDELDSTEATQISRIAMSLSQTSMGLDLQSGNDNSSSLGLTFSRILTHWINRHHLIIDPRTAMRVAVRYKCDQAAMRIAKRTLSNPISNPSAKVTAMLTLSTLSIPEPETQKSETQKSVHHSQEDLKAFITDARTAHVWQAITDRKIKIQTQVRDVAIALMLDQAGQDPRQFGFTYLEADPLLRFRDYSLGFENDQVRNTAHADATHFLATVK